MRSVPRACSFSARIHADGRSSGGCSRNILRSGAAHTLRGVQKRRPSLYDLVDQMKQITVPAMVMTGDEDDPCIEPSLLMKRAIPSAALVMFPRTGHALNLEEPALFNLMLEEFFHQIESGRWTMRDPRSLTGRIL